MSRELVCFNLRDMDNDILKTLSRLISESPYSDMELSKKANVTRDMIYKWRTLKVKSVRKSNLVAVANALGKDVHYNDDGTYKLADFKIQDQNFQTTPLEENEMSANPTEKLIGTMQKTIDHLMTQNELKDKAIEHRENIIKSLDETISNLSVSEGSENSPLLELDEIQCATSLEGNFTDVTMGYAKMLGYDSRFDLIGESWFKVVPDEDIQKWMEQGERETISRGKTEEYPNLHLKHKDGYTLELYCKTYFINSKISINTFKKDSIKILKKSGDKGGDTLKA